MKLSSITENLCLRVINTRGCSRFIAVAVVIMLYLPWLTAQDGSVRPSVTEARAAWERGNYALAYEQYNGLLLLYSRDPLYKYNAGACLVMLEQDIPRAVTLLGSAINSSVNVKSVPDDAWFYYGRALQMDGSFTQAIEAFDRFARVAGRRLAEEYDVRSYTEQCSRGQGALSLATAAGKNATSGTYTPAGTAVASRTVPAAGTNNPAAVPTTVPAAGTNNPAGKTTSGNGTGTTSINNAARTLPAAARTANPAGISASGEVPHPPQGEPISQHPVARNQAMGEGAVHPEMTVPDEYDKILAEGLRLQHEADSALITAGDTVTSITLGARADSLFISLEEHAGSSSEKAVPAEPELSPREQVVSLFEVRQSSAYSQTNPVPVDFPIPAGLVYTIQIAAFRNTVAASLFRGLYPVFGGKREGSDVIFYYTGLFRRLDDARQALPEARTAGFPDAFIIAFMDGNRVSMERAGMLEKEWASKPLQGKEILVPVQNERPTDTVAPVRTLSFRAEVMRVSKPVKPDMIEKMELLAGSRGMDMIKNSDGETVFLIGNFITFESADEYVSLLIRNGYSTARVAAYVGMQEIPVDSAKELLNRLHDD